MVSEPFTLLGHIQNPKELLLMCRLKVPIPYLKLRNLKNTDLLEDKQ